MSRTTRFLKLFLPEDNDYYRVEEDQNENFEKIDKKLEEWDTGKEPTIKYKKSGFNLDKTDSYEENNANKLATARALYLLWKAFKAKIKAIKLTWEAIEDKPLTFPPSEHNHNADYYTKIQIDKKTNKWEKLWAGGVDMHNRNHYLSQDLNNYKFLYLLTSLEPKIYNDRDANTLGFLLPIIKKDYLKSRMYADLAGGDWGYARVRDNHNLELNGYSGTYLIEIWGLTV